MQKKYINEYCTYQRVSIKEKFQHGQEVFQINKKWKEFIQFTKLEMKGGA